MEERNEKLEELANSVVDAKFEAEQILRDFEELLEDINEKKLEEEI